MWFEWNFKGDAEVSWSMKGDDDGVCLGVANETR